jgi:ATP-binding cassette subfamily B protein
MTEPAGQTDKMTFAQSIRMNLRAYQIWWGIRPGILLAPLCCAAAEGLTPYAAIYLSARIIDELAGERNLQTLTALVLTALISAAALTLLGAGLRRWKNCQQAGIGFMRNKIDSDKMLSLDFAKMDDPETHNLMSQIRQVDQWGNWGLSRALWSLEPMIKAVITIAGAFALTASLFTLRVPAGDGLALLNHPLFTCLMIAGLLAVTLAAPMLSAKADAYWPRYSEEAKMGNRYFGFFGFRMSERPRALDVRMYRQDRYTQTMIDKQDMFLPGSQIARWAKGPMGGLSALSGAVSQVFIGAAYIFVCLKALGGAFGIGSVTQYVASITALAGGVSALIVNIGNLRNNAPFLKTVYTFLDFPNATHTGGLPLSLRPGQPYEIEFRDVSFRYPGQETYALRHLSMKLTAGERLAVVGMNGSGKTTFIKLLCRLYDPSEGEILLNGVNIRAYDYQDYLAVFSVVFQDFKLLAFPLGQNVAAQITYEPARTKACLDEAGFTARMEEWPDGLETNLYKDFDEKGVDVSGGEAQKIALARVLYKDAAFIILDEPTAALDPVAEYEVYSRMNGMVGEKTAVFISHRLSSCRFCRSIAVFHEGEIVQRGSHEALAADEKGKYYELWNAQAQYYINPAERDD